MKKAILLLIGSLLITILSAQGPFKFAFISDTHIGSQTAEEDLDRTITSINDDDSIAFVVITGDITEFGSDEELQMAKRLFDKLNRPWYIVPGNHDAGWSESGSNSFQKIFGAETFQFIHNNYLFIGTASGPNMRMSPGQVPREQIVWLDSSLNDVNNRDRPIIYLNHYPQDSSLNNWYEVIDRLKTKNVQLILCGHGHANHRLNFEGIPAVMGRSNLRAKNAVGAYNVVTIKDSIATFEERNPLTNEQRKWTEVKLVKRDFTADTTRYVRPSYVINSQFPNVKLIWQYKDNSDIGSGTSISSDLIFATNTRGSAYALNKRSGKKIWEFTTGGKIYSTPAVAGNRVVISSTDNNIYCIDLRTGKQIWKFETSRPIVANPIVKDQTIFTGSSDGHFRAIDLARGQLKWDFDSVNNFVVTRPLFYGNKIIFGSWGTEL
ncbi:MAG TPA: PQQ-binding-like beta-propeller repeat protein, partial [Flavitalea sp.]|nr:PQQ-binding-like beta-propeller repeat protein [Flavitalea sp.]